MLHIRMFARLMAGIFAVQLFAAGFCMMMPEEHAMPVATYSNKVDISNDHCATAAEATHDAGMDQSACAHFNQPDELLQISHANVDVELLLLGYISLQLNTIPMAESLLTLNSHPATGPPGSSTPLYQTTQRIRI